MHLKCGGKNQNKNYQLWINFSIFLTVLTLDRISKVLVLKLEQNLKLLPFLEIVLVKNKGIVFGLFSGGNIGNNMLTISSIISVILITVIFCKFTNKTLIPILSLIIGGAVGNILDRVLYGYVIDFIKIDSFYVFNIADASITIGSTCLVIYAIFYGREHKSIKS